MKKIFLVLALGLGLTTFAQQGKTMTPEELYKAHMDKLTSELTLDAAQQEQVGKIMTDRNAKLRDIKKQMDALKKQMQAVATDTKSKMKAALKPEQYTKWLEMREQTIDKMKKSK